MSLTLLHVFILLTGLMVWQVKSAEAHSLEHLGAYEPAVQSQSAKSSETSVSKDEVVVAEAVSIASSPQEDNCKDACCSLGGSCCSSAAISSSQSFDINVVRDAFYSGLSELPLPQGPPSSLLRPPRFSA